jgi:hypothetical protein
MNKSQIGFIVAFIIIAGLLLGCNSTTSEKIIGSDRQEDRYFQRTVSDSLGRPILKITGEYTGKQPYAGYETAAPWKTIDTDFYNIEFKNLTHNQIAFISKKVYQRNPQAFSAKKGDPLPVLTGFADFRRTPDSNFEPLEPQEERKLINWAIHTNNQLSNDVANIVFRIRHAAREYSSNLILVYHR